MSDGRNNEVARTVSRGVSRLLCDMDADCLFEFTLRTGRRVDAIGLDRNGEFIIVEVKSSVADFRSDSKWRDYLDYCDLFYFAVPAEFPVNILPSDCGVIVADAFGGEILREARQSGMNAARRRALTLRFARTAATRLMRRVSQPAEIQPLLFTD